MTEGSVSAYVLPLAAQRDVRKAVDLLESPSFAVRLADYAGKPLTRALGFVPKLDSTLRKLAQSAILRCLEVAIDSQEDEDFPPSSWLPRALTGLTGGIGGLFGAVALPVELPLTTTLMLRAIADIARHQGEDLSTVDGRLACLEVFGLGAGRSSDKPSELGYYASRVLFAKLSSDVVSFVAERNVLDISAPVVTRLVGEIAGRFGIVLSERVAAGVVPVLGAVSGATLNVMFTSQFERIAIAHFTLRRLEREYGGEVIQQHCKWVASRGDRS
jgi:hypothetical protein